mmetsp:Transcript_13023/g.42431  ORF Transcript_13023/g.42431 Transcript_13023/m.42431 type:complete len:589 (+) Transcript_13023:117-1883(+)
MASADSCVDDIESEAARIVAALESGETTISEILGPLFRSGRSASIPLPRGDDKTRAVVAPEYPMLPESDEVVRATVEHVGPKHLPKLQESYDVVAIGAGVAGLLTVIVGKALGKKCLLVEKHYVGGDCLNVGCFPSKCLIACARKAHEMRNASDFGVSVPKGEVTVDFPKVMNRMRELRGSIAPHDGVQRYLRDFCEDVAIAEARFVDKKTIEIFSPRGEGGDDKEEAPPQRVTFDKCFVCTGASATVVAIPGLREVPHLTNGNFFNLQELPPRACLIGAGPIGIELAQALQRCGCAVTIFEIHSHLLPREDDDAAALVQEALLEDGVTVLCGVKLDKVTMSSSSEEETSLYKSPWPKYVVAATLEDGTRRDFECEAVLNATGRSPNVSDLGLDLAGVEYDTRSGVHVDDYGATSNTDVYAAGDVCSAYKFTHAADFMGRVAVRNAFLGAKEPYSKLLVPWTTYTDPEIAHVGLYEKEIDEPYETYVRHLKDVDRCKCEGITRGFVKISCRKGTDKILGATIVGPNAGDLLSEISVALQNDIGLRHIAAVMHPYPTTAEAIRQCAAQYKPLDKQLTSRVLLELMRRGS